jgi:hypothetical protein
MNFGRASSAALMLSGIAGVVTPERVGADRHRDHVAGRGCGTPGVTCRRPPPHRLDHLGLRQSTDDSAA